MITTSLRRRRDATEMLDGELDASADLKGNLDDLARVNRWTGADRLRHEALARLLAGYGPLDPLLLDVGGGRGDGLWAARQWASRRRIRCRTILLDRSLPILSLATLDHWQPCRICADGRRLPLVDGSVDVAWCALTLHHCSPDDARRLLSEMRRVARLGVIVDDLLRSRLGMAGAQALARFATRNRLTRHDAPLSVRRAYSKKEIDRLLASAGLTPRWQATVPGYRTIIAARSVSV